MLPKLAARTNQILDSTSIFHSKNERHESNLGTEEKC
jgi:hypothetical protein